MAVAALMTPFLAEIRRVFGSPFLRVHHVFAAFGLAAITLRPVRVAVRSASLLVFLPVTPLFEGYIANAGRFALPLIYSAVVGALTRTRLGKWRYFHLVVYLALVLGLIHGTLFSQFFFGNPLSSPPCTWGLGLRSSAPSSRNAGSGGHTAGREPGQALLPFPANHSFRILVNSMGKGTIVLAFSGGLDTSICVPLLKERYGYDRVVTVAVDVGQTEADLRMATEKGERIADRHVTIDVRDRFVNEHVFRAIRANGSYEGYPMGTSLARPLIAEECVRIAREEGATAVAHGCTGKGNDQLRFDFIIRASGLDVVAPIREQNLTREWEMGYAAEHGIPVPVAKEKPWSMDENCWSRSIEGGRLENPAYHPPEEIWHWTTAPEAAPDTSADLSITFEEGVPIALDGALMKGFDLVKALNLLAGAHGVGRNDMIEDRVLGLKARECYEHPAATVLLAAHRDLERLVLTRQELAFKAGVDEKWSELAYMGLVYEPLYCALNAFIDETQSVVSGTVDLRLYKGGLRILGRSSPHALYSDELVSFDSTSLDQCSAIGFSEYFGLQARMRRRA
jgi:argininosuccinate synthase